MQGPLNEGYLSNAGKSATRFFWKLSMLSRLSVLR